MVAYGGAGPVSATLVARELRVRRVIIPNAPGHFSAFGMLLADLRRDYVRTLFLRLDAALIDSLRPAFEEMENEGRAEMLAAAGTTIPVSAEYGVDMRYVGQEHSVTVTFSSELARDMSRSGIKAAFDATHEQRYGYCSADELAEIVSVRCVVTGSMPKPKLVRIEADPEPSRRRHGVKSAPSTSARMGGLFQRLFIPGRDSSRATDSQVQRWSKNMQRQRSCPLATW